MAVLVLDCVVAEIFQLLFGNFLIASTFGAIVAMSVLSLLVFSQRPLCFVSAKYASPVQPQNLAQTQVLCCVPIERVLALPF